MVSGRQRGSQIVLTEVGRIATLSIPDHHDVARGTLSVLISKAGLTVEEFLAALTQSTSSDQFSSTCLTFAVN